MDQVAEDKRDEVRRLLSRLPTAKRQAHTEVAWLSGLKVAS
jgi:hypothetical protein